MKQINYLEMGHKRDKQSPKEEGIKEAIRLFKLDKEQIKLNTTTITRALRVVEKALDIALQEQQKQHEEEIKKNNIEICRLFQSSEDSGSEEVRHWIDVYYKLMCGNIEKTETYQRQVPSKVFITKEEHEEALVVQREKIREIIERKVNNLDNSGNIQPIIKKEYVELLKEFDEAFPK